VSELAAQPLLEVRGLTKHFGGVAAVDGVSLRVFTGQIVSLIGPNGSGKTTTFNLIGGQIRPDSGEVSLGGSPITAFESDRVAARGVARTFQNGRTFGNMTVAENVAMGMHTRLHVERPFAALRERPLLEWGALLAETAVALTRPPGVAREAAATRAEVERQLRRFGDRLLPRSEHYAHTLSYANRRRTEIARALALGPRLLLLDEPTAGMNPSETREVLEQIALLRSEGLTILLIEHKLDLVMTLSDNIVVLDDGKVIAEGTPAQIQTNEAVVAAYLGRPSQNGTRKRAVLPKRPASAPAQVPAPLLALEEIDAFYGGFQALSKVSLEVGAGEIVCLLGGNASGKSTTMKVALGLVQPRRGRVFVDGHDATAASTAQHIERGLASVPEARRVFAEMSVEENLRMGAFLRRDARGIRDDLERMYALFPRLGERRRQLAGSMSGGEQQMLAMARALMSRPKLICMDEPTMGLAPIVVEHVLETIVAVQAQGVSVFIVEQNATLALSIAARAYVIQNGRIVLAGESAEISANPAIQDAYLGRRESVAPA
jgi:ABC-type branched-subunit amino acid transport system ATPase component